MSGLVIKRKLSEILHLSKSRSNLWIFAYFATIIIPWGLIFSRSIAEISIISIGVLWLAESFINKKWQWLNDPIVKIGIISWAWLLFISLFANNSLSSFEVALPWIRFILFYAALKYWVLQSKEDFKLLLTSLIIMLGFIMIDTLWQYINEISLTGNLIEPGRRLTGPLNNVKIGVFTAKILIPTIGICLLFATQSKKTIGKTLTLTLLICGIIMVLLSGERTAFASSLIAILTVSLYLAISEAKLRKYITISIALILASVITMLKTQQWVWNRALEFYAVISNYPQSNYGQLASAGYLTGKYHTSTGAGLKGFREFCPTLISNNEVHYCNIHPHNTYLEWFATSGIIGLILFITMVICLVGICAKALQSQNASRKLIPALALATVITNFFPFMPTQSIFSNWPAILLWYSVSISIASLNVLKEKEHPSPS